MLLPPNRILMTADTVGGVWTYALELSRELGKQNVEVCLATMGARPTSGQREEAAAIETLRLFDSAYKLEWMQGSWADVEAAGEWLLRLEDRLQPTVVHLNGYCHGHLEWQAPTVMVAHSCVLSWWRAIKARSATGDWDEYRGRVRRGVHSADALVAPTRAMLRSIEQNYGRLDRSRVINNGIGADGFGRAAKRHFIFSAGRLWDEAKNVGVLDRVADQLAWPVYIAGDATEPSGAVNGTSTFHSAKLLGKLTPVQMRDWYARAAIYALPAKYEPFGLSILEAALSGCALLLGDIPSLRELWDGAAAFVDPGDEEALAAAINELATQDWMRNELAWRARERARRYSAERMAGTHLDLYREVTTKRAPRIMEAAVCA